MADRFRVGDYILWIDDDDVFGGLGGTQGLSIERFEKRLADEMVVPSRLLKVTYSIGRSSKPHLLFPEGGTTRKR